MSPEIPSSFERIQGIENEPFLLDDIDNMLMNDSQVSLNQESSIY